MKEFTYTALPSKVIFGFGTMAQAAQEIDALGCRRALVLTTPGHKESVARLEELIGDWRCGTFAGAAMHTPTDVTERAVEAVKELRADCLVAIGGGSSIGLGKAIAHRLDLPQMVLPTTYAGSEATSILGQTENGIKTTLKGPEILPETIIYDVDLTLTLPPFLSATSGMNAIAHAVEALYSRDANPIITSLAALGIEALSRSLPQIIRDPQDHEARSDALFGAYACGVCLGSVGMSVHHKLCHVLGGSFGLPHAETHSVILPHAVAYVASHAPDAMARLSTILEDSYPAGRLFDFGKSLSAPSSLASIGMEEADLDRAAEIATAAPYWSPRPIERGAIRALLERAYRGLPPLPG